MLLRRRKKEKPKNWLQSELDKMVDSLPDDIPPRVKEAIRTRWAGQAVYHDKSAVKNKILSDRIKILLIFSSLVATSLSPMTLGGNGALLPAIVIPALVTMAGILGTTVEQWREAFTPGLVYVESRKTCELIQRVFWEFYFGTGEFEGLPYYSHDGRDRINLASSKIESINAKNLEEFFVQKDPNKVARMPKPKPVGQATGGMTMRSPAGGVPPNPGESMSHAEIDAVLYGEGL